MGVCFENLICFPSLLPLGFGQRGVVLAGQSGGVAVMGKPENTAFL